jgi:hypothetical protein
MEMSEARRDDALMLARKEMTLLEQRAKQPAEPTINTCVRGAGAQPGGASAPAHACWKWRSSVTARLPSVVRVTASSEHLKKGHE